MKNFFGIACLAALTAGLCISGSASAAIGACAVSVQDAEQVAQVTDTAKDSVIKVLIEAAKDKNPSMRAQVINLLGQYIQDRQDVRELIVAAVNDESREVRRAALQPLLTVADPSPELLARIVELQLEFRQLTSRRATIRRYEEQVVPLLVNHLRTDADAESKSHLCQALGSLREDARSALPLLLELVANADEDYQVRAAAANAAESIARFADAADEEIARRAAAAERNANSQADRFMKFAEAFVANNDKDGDRKLEKSEWPQTRMIDLVAADANQDGMLTVEEITNQLQKPGGSRN